MNQDQKEQLKNIENQLLQLKTELRNATKKLKKLPQYESYRKANYDLYTSDLYKWYTDKKNQLQETDEYITRCDLLKKKKELMKEYLKYMDEEGYEDEN